MREHKSVLFWLAGSICLLLLSSISNHDFLYETAIRDFISSEYDFYVIIIILKN